MSEIKVNKITPRVACGTTQLGDSGDTITIPSGATIQNLGTATGFGGTGVVSWDTTPKTTGFTAVTGTGYFCDTATTSAFTVTLPLSPSAGDVIGVSDYAKNFNTDALTLARNGENIGGAAVDATLSTNGEAVTLVYVDSTKGWIVTDSGNQADAPTALYVAATGGCENTDGDYKMHTFLGPGTFEVTCAGNPAGSTVLDYLIIGGGGSGGRDNGGGGGGGGVRFTCSTWPNSGAPVAPRGCVTGTTASVASFAIAVGGGGTPGGTAPVPLGPAGTPSSFNSVIGTGGGAGGADGTTNPARDGGSGGGGGQLPSTAGSGNTPPTSPQQGTDGGSSAGPAAGGAGGGGYMVAAGCSPAGDGGGIGGAGGGFPGSPAVFGPQGVTCGSYKYFAGGGGGGSGQPGGGSGGAGGLGGGGAGGGFCGNNGIVGTCNTGGGGGGGSQAGCGAAGGSGVVVIRYKYQ